MNYNQLWGEQGKKLENYDGEFPVDMVFYDVQDGEVKEMQVTEQAWNHTLKTFEGQTNVSDNVVMKHLSTHDTVKPKPYFNED